MRELAQEELRGLKSGATRCSPRSRFCSSRRIPNDEKNVVLEIRAGTGGEEAALFAYELFRMYNKFAEKQGWRVEVMSTSESDVGGVKEVIATIEGRGVVQQAEIRERRAPRAARPGDRGSGRIHTSTVTVAVLPEAEEVDVQIDAEGSAHRHLLLERPRRPERQHDLLGRPHHAHPHRHRGLAAGRKIADQEQAKAMRVLRSRLYEMEMRKQQEAIAKDRRSQVGTGERSEKIRTYNFRENRITDHRVNFTTHQLTEVLKRRSRRAAGQCVDASTNRKS